MKEATTEQMYETTTDAAVGTTETVEEITNVYNNTDGHKVTVHYLGTSALKENERGMCSLFNYLNVFKIKKVLHFL